jgi:hypothetical protein
MFYIFYDIYVIKNIYSEAGAGPAVLIVSATLAALGDV